MAAGHSAVRATQQQLKAYKRFCGFTEDEVNLVLARYREVDRSKNFTAGIWYEDIARFVEYQGNRLLLLVAKLVAGSASRLNYDKFVRLVWLLSSQASVQEKKDILWSALDTRGVNRVYRQDLYRFLSHCLSGCLSQDQLLELAESALEYDGGGGGGGDSEEPHITRSSFFKHFASDTFVFQRLTVDLHILPTASA